MTHIKNASLIQNIQKTRNTNFYVVKTSDIDVVNKFKKGETDFELDGLNGYDKNNQDKITSGVPLFLVFGGNNVPWTLGLVAVCKTTSGPKNYDNKNYTLSFNVVSRLPETMTKADFIPYRDSYDSFIGPNTKGSRNQALFKISENQVVGVLRGVLDRYPDLETSLSSLFSSGIIAKVKKPMEVFLPVVKAFGDTAVHQTPCNVMKSGLSGKNILLYGVPGCGKSHAVKTEYCNDDAYMERVVFHPDYTYSDFAGQILPKINAETKQIEYSFSQGPFTRILSKAYSDKQHMYYLVIEEINRGNAPAIFGDIFQLLDRDSYGESIYGITNYDIADAVFGNRETKIKIPSNLTVLATMNTSDQSVFTLDTAFKRRWNMRMIKNDVDKHSISKTDILESGVTWGQFVNTVNEIILSENSDMMSNEDKRLGAYFINEEDLQCIDGEYNPAFAEKVIMYLWNDVFKYNREIVFAGGYNSLEKVIETFETEKFKVFNLDFGSSEEESEENEQ